MGPGSGGLLSPPTGLLGGLQPQRDVEEAVMWGRKQHVHKRWRALLWNNGVLVKAEGCSFSRRCVGRDTLSHTPGQLEVNFCLTASGFGAPNLVRAKGWHGDKRHEQGLEAIHLAWKQLSNPTLCSGFHLSLLHPGTLATAPQATLSLDLPLVCKHKKHDLLMRGRKNKRITYPASLNIRYTLGSSLHSSIYPKSSVQSRHPALNTIRWQDIHISVAVLDHCKFAVPHAWSYF